MKRTELIGKNFDELGYSKWRGCIIGADGCIYAMPGGEGGSSCRFVLKIDPTDDSTTLVGPKLVMDRDDFTSDCIKGPDGMMYTIPRKADYILKFNPINEKVTKIKRKPGGAGTSNGYSSAAVTPNGMIYFFPSLDHNSILCLDPSNQSTSLIGEQHNRFVFSEWAGAVLAPSNGCIYFVPFGDGANRVMKFDPSDHSTTLIGDDFSHDLDEEYSHCKWIDAVLGPDGNVYGIPCNHNYILKIDVATQTTSLVGTDLRDFCEYDEGKYINGVVGHDSCLYLIPEYGEYFLRFNTITGVTSTVSENFDEGHQYDDGVLASNGYIYFPPNQASQVLKIRSWSNWLYLKYRLLVETRRAARKVIQFDDDLNIVQHFIIHTNDDIFRTVIEMLEY